MTKPKKLYQLLLAGRAGVISFRDFVRLLEAFGFRHHRTSGSHHVYGHIKLARPLIIQPIGKDAKAYQVAQFLDMVEQSGLKLDE
ncbi:type II toxin-antitoxin system HicA family toxin [Blastomonas sp.]|uniref:type II toxin-antitoxin system HicA family toxin n=1 Tax=Blastomonas sp. TaxID=1909299 RepID=UPI003592EC3E